MHWFRRQHTSHTTISTHSHNTFIKFKTKFHRKWRINTEKKQEFLLSLAQATEFISRFSFFFYFFLTFDFYFYFFRFYALILVSLFCCTLCSQYVHRAWVCACTHNILLFVWMNFCIIAARSRVRGRESASATRTTYTMNEEKKIKNNMESSVDQLYRFPFYTISNLKNTQ